MTTPLLLTDEDFAAAMAPALADPTNSATPGDAPDTIAYDPDVLAAEGGGDDPNACADHVGDPAPDDAGLSGALGFAAAAGWRATWLADEFRRAGLVVVEVEGWKNRGATFPDPPTEEGVGLFHHTASNRNSGPAGGLRIVAYGREGLAGPIANWLTARNGVIYVVAAGIANNAGQGNARAAGMPNVTGNSNTLADEMENDGIGEPYPAVQRTAAMRAHAVVHRKMGWPAARGIGHLEWSTSGKVDPLVRTWGSMSACRASLATFIAGTANPEEDELMADNDRIKLPQPNATGRPDIARIDLWRVGYLNTEVIKAQLAASETREKATLTLLEKALGGEPGSVDMAQIKTWIEAEGEKSRAAQAERDARVADALDPSE